VYRVRTLATSSLDAGRRLSLAVPQSLRVRTDPPRTACLHSGTLWLSLDVAVVSRC
jgi:hypothetical protein